MRRDDRPNVPCGRGALIAGEVHRQNLSGGHRGQNGIGGPKLGGEHWAVGLMDYSAYRPTLPPGLSLAEVHLRKD